MQKNKILIISIILIFSALFAYSQSWTYILQLDIGSDNYKDIEYFWDVAPPNPTIDESTRIDKTGEFNVQRLSCDCQRCEIVGGACMVPVFITANHGGQLLVHDVKSLHEVYSEEQSVNYGETFGKKIGSCWEVYSSVIGGTTTFAVPSDLICEGGDYNYYTPADHDPPTDNDAISDAVFRLLNQTLDLAENGQVDFDPNTRKITASGEMKGQSMWGPLEMRLIVWI